MKLKVVTWISIFLIASNVVFAKKGKDMYFKEYLWKKRVIVILSSNLEKKENQLLLFSKVKSQMDERDLVIYKTDSSVDLNDYFDVKEAYTILLIGKDGTVKLRSNKLIPVKELFKLIDSMPMRQSEMNR